MNDHDRPGERFLVVDPAGIVTAHTGPWQMVAGGARRVDGLRVEQSTDLVNRCGVSAYRRPSMVI